MYNYMGRLTLNKIYLYYQAALYSSQVKAGTSEDILRGNSVGKVAIHGTIN